MLVCYGFFVQQLLLIVHEQLPPHHTMRRRLLLAIAVCVSVAAVADAENANDLFADDLTDLIGKGTVRDVKGTET